MKNTTVTVSYNEEKLAALMIYLEQRGVQIEDELAKALDAIYTKSVPAGVREFIELHARSGKPTRRKAKGVSPIAAVNTQEVNANE